MKYRAQKSEQLTINGEWELEFFVLDGEGKKFAKCWELEDAHAIADALNAAVLK